MTTTDPNVIGLIVGLVVSLLAVGLTGNLALFWLLRRSQTRETDVRGRVEFLREERKETLESLK